MTSPLRAEHGPCFGHAPGDPKQRCQEKVTHVVRARVDGELRPERAICRDHMARLIGHTVLIHSWDVARDVIKWRAIDDV
jgi:hypothetical protein